MVSDASIIDLVEGGLFKDAAREIDSRQSPSNALRVLRARLELDIGSQERARLTAEQLLSEHLSNSDKCICWEIIARVNFRTGCFDEALTASHRAFQYAERSLDPRVRAR